MRAALTFAFAAAAAAASHAAAAAPPPPPARRLPAAIENLVVPPAGALTPISGRVVGLPPEPHVVCVYLESRSGSKNGPKPMEDAGSSSPVDPATGAFNYVGWWANAMYDVVAVNIYVFAWPTRLGVCLPVVGGPDSEGERGGEEGRGGWRPGEVGGVQAQEGQPLRRRPRRRPPAVLTSPPRRPPTPHPHSTARPAVPAGMFTQSAAYAVVPRADPINVTVVSQPVAGAQGAVVARVTGLTAPPGTYAVSLFARVGGAGGRLVGPLPGCADPAATAPLVEDPDLTHTPAGYLATFPGWFAGANAPLLQGATGFVAALYASAYPITGVAGQWGAPATCLVADGAGAVAEFPASFPRISVGEAARPPPPSATPSAQPPPSPALSTGASPSRTPSGSGAGGAIVGQGDATATAASAGGGASSGAGSEGVGVAAVAAAAALVAAVLA